MRVSFNHYQDSQFFTIRFEAAKTETVPFLNELRFWGVDRFPCRQLSTLAALLVLGSQAARSLTLQDALSPAVCTALSRHFGIELHPASYDANRRGLAGGDKIIAPMRFGTNTPMPPIKAAEVLTWISLDDFSGPYGGQIRTNLDAFPLSEAEKNLIIALCCAGMDVGHIAISGATPDMAQIIHQIGLELIHSDVTD